MGVIDESVDLELGDITLDEPDDALIDFCAL